MARLKAAHVLIVGVGGVGGWCAEALARTGVGALTIMDDDIVVASNLNRQCAATVPALGKVKVEAMRERLAAVNPECRVTAVRERWGVGADHQAARSGALNGAPCGRPLPDVVVDAIDSVDCKAALIAAALEANVPIVSSMGAALRLDPTRVRIGDFSEVTGDGLARALRKKFGKLVGSRVLRDRERFEKLRVVWSDERPCKAEIRGSYMPVVAAFGMGLASEVIRQII